MAAGQRHYGDGNAEQMDPEHGCISTGADNSPPIRAQERASWFLAKAPQNSAIHLGRGAREKGGPSLGLRRARGKQRTLHAIRVFRIKRMLRQALLSMITAEKPGKNARFRSEVAGRAIPADQAVRTIVPIVPVLRTLPPPAGGYDEAYVTIPRLAA